MTQRRHLTLVSAGATVLAALPLASVFERWTWLVGALLVVGAMAGTAVLLRSVRAHGWAPAAGMIGALVVSLTWLFGDGRALLGIVPTLDTLGRFHHLLASAVVAIRESGVPVADEDGLLFLATLGVGAMLLAVDLAVVVGRRPAIAGIPMFAVYLVPVATHTGSVSFLAFVCTAAAFLWLLAADNVDRVRRFGRRFTGDGRDIDVWEPSPLAAAGRRLAVIGVATALILPIAVPGLGSGLLGRFGIGIGDGPGAGGDGGDGPGGSGEVNLFSYLHGALVRGETYDMVRVTTNDPNPFYLRLGVAEDVTGNGFVSRPWSRGQSLTDIPPPMQGTGVEYRTHRAQVEIIQFNGHLLPVYQQLRATDRIDDAWRYDQRAGVVYATRANAKGRTYGFTYVRGEFTPEALRTARELPADHPLRRSYTAVPEVPVVAQTAQNLVKDKATQYDKVRAIHDFFSRRNGFSYSLATRVGSSGSAMADFITTGKQGYCEQFAAAMAWMVRAVDIPARVAFGWTRGNKRKDNTYTLTNSNLHAWVEVYFEGYGWVPFDPTPASGVAGSVPSGWAPDPNRSAPPATAPGEDDPGVTGSASGRASAPAGGEFAGDDPTSGGGAGDAGGAGGVARWPFALLGGVLAGLVLFLLPALRRAALRRRRWPGGALAAGQRRARRDAHAAWHELLDTMVDHRMGIDPAESPRLTADRLISDLLLDSGPARGVRVLSRAEERARYARSPLTDVDLATPLRDVRWALRDGVSRRTRLVATLLPPSVLARWRAHLGARYAATVTAVGSRLGALGKAVSPRRLLASRTAR
jgi:transglutaminase-like putative cysteine protease